MYRLICCLLVSFVGSVAYSQLNTPPASPLSTLQTQIGLTQTTIVYHRPAVKGRIIFGALIPYGEVWRTGANAASRLTFSEEVLLDTLPIPAGTYALFTIPGRERWTVIISRQTELWGARGYDPAQDVARYELPVKTLPDRTESMELRWMNITHTQADLSLEWEYTHIRIPFRFNTHEQVQVRIDDALQQPVARDYYAAARYYLDNDLDLAKAKSWMDKWFALEGEQFGIMRYQAIIEKRLGNDEAARRIMERSLALAREQPNPHYVRMNEKTLREWTEQPYPFSAEEVLQQSIAYHDPADRWQKDTFAFRLHEARPGGGYRITDLALSERHQYFRLDQIADTARLIIQLSPDTCGVFRSWEHQTGDSTPTEASAMCQFGASYRDYYTYLWGMPMKLRDPGTQIDSEAKRVDFFGEELVQIRATYTREVGDDVWYFYFSPDQHALRGYRFYHEEANNDGEYILLEDEVQVGKLLLPAKRHWYYHKNGEYLGSDSILAY
ncbi:MAG: DUF6503 family protein [Bacteroidota bacterium]